jgi:Flp pilus assembly pilin Flp
MKTLLKDESAATTLEWALLLFAIGLPSYYLVTMTLDILLAHYRLMTTLNALPFP